MDSEGLPLAEFLGVLRLTTFSHRRKCGRPDKRRRDEFDHLLGFRSGMHKGQMLFISFCKGMFCGGRVYTVPRLSATIRINQRHQGKTVCPHTDSANCSAAPEGLQKENKRRFTCHGFLSGRYKMIELKDFEAYVKSTCSPSSNLPGSYVRALRYLDESLRTCVPKYAGLPPQKFQSYRY